MRKPDSERVPGIRQPAREEFRKRASEAEVAFAFGNALEALHARVAELLVLHLRELEADDGLALSAGLLRRVVAEILLHREDGVGLAVVRNGAVLRKFHEAVARAAGAVAGRAEAREIVVLEEPAHHFVSERRSFVSNCAEFSMSRMSRIV